MLDKFKAIDVSIMLASKLTDIPFFICHNHHAYVIIVKNNMYHNATHNSFRVSIVNSLSKIIRIVHVFNSIDRIFKSSLLYLYTCVLLALLNVNGYIVICNS